MMHYLTREDITLAAACGSLVLTACFGIHLLDRADAAQIPPASTPTPFVLNCAPDRGSLESPDEDTQINAALLEQGYLRDDVPLSYDLQAVLHAECEHYDIPYSLALGLMEVGNGFQTNTISDSNSSSSADGGLCQHNPNDFPSNLSDVEHIRYVLESLSVCMNAYDSVEAALTAYHNGVDTGERAYAEKVLQAAQRWELE